MAERMQDRPPDAANLREVLRAVIDPEAGVNIVDLGLVYDISVREGGVTVTVGMTSPACPLGDVICEDVESALREAVPAGWSVEAVLTDTPAWDPSRMSDEARRHFGE